MVIARALTSLNQKSNNRQQRKLQPGLLDLSLSLFVFRSSPLETSRGQDGSRQGLFSFAPPGKADGHSSMEGIWYHNRKENGRGRDVKTCMRWRDRPLGCSLSANSQRP
ncbi:Non-heme chloroperoxidase [Fusarium oxysporum f. sp. albedinis]|nr:Non-heme chloroperoxidase [Fusarium oxysporum f. sp. albedinis]